MSLDQKLSESRYSKVVTQFLFSTCVQHQLNFEALRALLFCASALDKHVYDDDNDELAVIPLITGSAAEFYIHPMFSCVGDIDVMVRCNNTLSIPEGTAPPTHLPAEFHSRVKVFDIKDSEFPGYVNLVRSYLLTALMTESTTPSSVHVGSLDGVLLIWSFTDQRLSFRCQGYKDYSSDVFLRHLTL